MTHPLRGPVELPRGGDLGCLLPAVLLSSSAYWRKAPLSLWERTLSRSPDVFLAVRFWGISHFSMITINLLCWLSVGNDVTPLDRGVQGNEGSS